MGSRAYTYQKGAGWAKREEKSEIDFDFLLSKPHHAHTLSLPAKNSRKMKKLHKVDKKATFWRCVFEEGI